LILGTAVAAAETAPTRDKPPDTAPPAPAGATDRPDTWTWFGMGFESRRRRFGDDGERPSQPRSGQSFGGAGQSRAAGGR
jgi:hypothetical protein